MSRDGGSVPYRLGLVLPLPHVDISPISRHEAYVMTIDIIVPGFTSAAMYATIGSTAPALASLRRCRDLCRSLSATAAKRPTLRYTAYANNLTTNLSK